MTQPAQASRHTVDSITSDDLDQLYTELAKAKQDADDAIHTAAHLTTLVGKRSERAEKAAKQQTFRAKIAETELRTLRAGLRANGADPTQIQNLWAQISLRNRQWRDEKQRAKRAEGALDAVRAELFALNSETGGLNPYAMAGRRDAVARVRAALDAHTNLADQPT